MLFISSSPHAAFLSCNQYCSHLPPVSFCCWTSIYSILVKLIKKDADVRPYMKLCRFAVTRPTHENRTDSKKFLVRIVQNFFFIRFETLSYLEGNTKSNFGEYKRRKFVKLVQKTIFYDNLYK